MYPMQFKPVFKDYLWGGRNLAGLGKKLPETGIVAESWEVSGHPEGPGVIENGELAGLSLPELIGIYPEKVLGNAVVLKYGSKFPLLVKLIDANQQLSVQVHPDDDYALTHEAEFGKHEIWYIIAARPGAQIIYGLVPGTTREEFARRIAAGEVESSLNYQEVAARDVIDIPPGMVHALGAGIILAEIQQNSNATYRVFDYNRLDAAGKLRPLHIQKALDVIDFTAGNGGKLPNGAPVTLSPESLKTTLAVNSHFQVDLYQVKGAVSEAATGERFYIYTVLDGEGFIAWGEEELWIKQGDSLLIPATLGRYQLSGEFQALKSFATTKLKAVGIGAWR
jgi:mannose-6-phosphate isomerase